MPTNKAKNELKNDEEKITTPLKSKSNVEILKYQKETGHLIPNEWKYPFFFNKKNYIAIIIGLNQRYEFERIFCEKIEYEHNEKLMIGFHPSYFKDGLIIEERYSFKEHNSFITKTNYYKIILFENSVWGEKISKAEIRDFLKNKQIELYDDFRILMDRFGESFTLYTMQSILKQKKEKDKSLFF